MDEITLTHAQAQDLRAWAQPAPVTAAQVLAHEEYRCALLAFRMIHGRPRDGAVA